MGVVTPLSVVLKLTFPVGIVPLLGDTVTVKVTELFTVDGDPDVVSVKIGVLWPIPLRGIDWLEFATLRLLSVVTREPVMGPDTVGMKLTLSVQLAPAASDPGLKVSCGQVELGLRLKLAEMLGLVPVAGTVNRSGEVPLFATVTVCGLSELVAPTAVEAKERVGGFCAFISFAALLPVSAT